MKQKIISHQFGQNTKHVFSCINMQIIESMCKTTDLDFGRINNDAVGGQVIRIIGIISNSAQGGDDFGGGLEAS